MTKDVTKETSTRERIARLKADQLAAVELVGEAHEALERAREAYDRAVMAAHELGASNTVIAKRIGKSETAVRLHIKRRKMGVKHK